MREVKKRDGRIVSFDENRIREAINRASAEVGVVDEPLVEKIVEKVKSLAEKKCLDVEQIQDAVEMELMKSSRKDVAKAYISYRHQRNLARKAKTSEALLSIMNIEKTAESRENANMNASTPAGQVIKAADELTKIFADEFLMSEETLTAKKGNYIWVHDQNYMFTRSSTCLHHPLDRILENGFKAGHGEVRPVKRIETAMTIAAISLETIQNEQHGGQSLGAFDYYTAPYVKLTYHEEFEKASELYGYDINIDVRDREIDEYETKNLSGISDPFERIRQHAINQTVKRVAQACEGFCHNMNNISSRGGNQVVFSSINYGTDTSAEGRAIIRQMLLATERGVGNGSTGIFPIQIYKLKKGYSYGVNKEGKRTNQDLYELACKVSAKRFYPNFLNLDSTFNYSESKNYDESNGCWDGWNENDPKRYLHEVATMGCRTRVFENRFGPKTSIARGNLSFTTINLPKIAIEVAIETGYLVDTTPDAETRNYIFDKSKNTPELINKRVNLFKEKLSLMTYITANQLNDRFNLQKQALAKQFPLLMSGMWLGSEKLSPEDSVESVINQGTLGIGFIGLAECLVALTGKHHGESDESQKIGLEIITQMRDDANKYSELYQHNYSVLATPAEGLSGKFTKVDKKTFGQIQGVTDRDYYTNSNHIPVYFPISARKKAEIECPYHRITLGGHIFYVEIDGDLTKNPESIMDIVDMAVENDGGYISINHFQGRCPICNYETTEKGVDTCPKCGEHMDTLQRITGLS